MKNILSKTVGATRALGVATFLASSAAQSDEAFLPPGTTLGQFPSSSIPTLQNTFATQIVSDITPDPALVPSNTFRWLLVKTDSGLALTLPENHVGSINHFGQQEKFFIRFDPNTGLPQISFDLQNWQAYTSGTPVNISREEQATVIDISNNLQTLNALQDQQQTLTTTLAAQVGELEQVQEQLDTLQSNLLVSSDELAIKESDLSNQESTRNVLENTMKPEAKLRTDSHPIAENTALDDTTKTSLTQTALNTYDAYEGAPEGPGTPLMSGPQFAPLSTFVPPTSAEVQSTITILSNELIRIQNQITTINTQITAKQNEITTTQNSINIAQQSLDQSTAQLTQYMNDYIYWRDEYNRLVALRDAASADLDNLRTTYASNRTRLMNEGGRSDVPSDIAVSDILSQMSSLKTRIMNEYSAIAIATNNWGTDITTNNLSDSKGPTLTRLDSSWYYYSDFYSLSKSYPATLKTYLKPVGSSSFALGTTTYTAYNTNHLSALINNTVKPRMYKLCDYTFADRVLETNAEDFVGTKADYNTYATAAATALGNRQTAQNNINSAQPLVDQRQTELNTLNTQKSTLTTQKSELESLKNTKSQLQTLYTRVKDIIDQLKLHVASHGSVTQEIANLIAQTQAIQDEIATLELIISSVEGDEADLINLVATTSDDITTINTSLSNTEQALLATLSSIATIIPQDSFSRNGTTLIPASQALNYFADGFRTGYHSRSIAGLPAKWMTRYAYDGSNALSTNIYPASVGVQFIVGSRAYVTDGQVINNFTHKELINGELEKTLTRLNTCIALLNQYPAGSVVGIENFLTALKAQIAGLQSSQSTNTTIRNHVTATNTFTKKTLLQSGSYALFERLVDNNPAFSLKIDEMVALMAQKGNIGDGTDAMNDLRHMVTTIFAQVFAERLMFSGTDGLDLYTDWEQESLSFINGLGGTSMLTNNLDMNADWSIDAHGNKYKFGLYHPAGLGNYNPPATLFIIYSPDGTNTQVLGPVQVSSGGQADIMKARWQQELLKMKRMHADYAGGTYDIFRGTDEKGEYVYWGKYTTKSGATPLGTSFYNSANGAEGMVKNNIVNSQIRSSIGLRVILPRGMDDIRKAEQYLFSLQSKYFYQISGISSKNGIRIDIESLDTLAEINSIRLGIISKIETPGFIGSLPQSDVDYLFGLRNRLISGISTNFSEQGGYWHMEVGKDSFAALGVLMVEFLGTLMQAASQSAYQDNLMIIPLLSQEKGDSLHAMFQEQYTTFGDATRLLTQEILDAAYGDDFYYLATGNPPVGYDIMYYASFFLPGPSEGAFALKTPSLARVAVKGGSKLEKLLFKEVAPGIVRQVAEDGKITEIVNGLARRASPEVDAMESIFHSRIGTFAQSDINTILSKDPTVVADEIYKIARDKAGRMVFLDKGTVTTADKLGSGLDHTIKEIKPGNITRYEQFRSGDNPVIPDGEDIENLIDKVISNYDDFVQTSNGKAMYTKKIGDKDIFIIINESSGKIITITP